MSPLLLLCLPAVRAFTYHIGSLPNVVPASARAVHPWSSVELAAPMGSTLRGQASAVVAPYGGAALGSQLNKMLGPIGSTVLASFVVTYLCIHLIPGLLYSMGFFVLRVADRLRSLSEGAQLALQRFSAHQTAHIEYHTVDEFAVEEYAAPELAMPERTQRTWSAWHDEMDTTRPNGRPSRDQDVVKREELMAAMKMQGGLAASARTNRKAPTRHRDGAGLLSSRPRPPLASPPAAGAVDERWSSMCNPEQA